jgi:hypothetical protein
MLAPFQQPTQNAQKPQKTAEWLLARPRLRAPAAARMKNGHGLGTHWCPEAVPFKRPGAA